MPPGIYKTPGVYVEEIPKFPPSIAPVETAIPAFIGYTEKAIRNGETLVNKPTRIESIAEYEFLFGGSPSQNVDVYLDSDNKFVRAEAAAKLYLYDSLRMFYANGGGNCYILSVGTYPTTVSSATLEAALVLLEQEDEPTIIIAPDVVSDSVGPYEFQKKALMQCNKLMDRVALCDLKKAADKTTTEFKITVDDFRNNIGINYLKYGAAYGPWIQANLPRTLKRRNVLLKRDGGTTAIELKTLTSDDDIRSLIAEVLNVETFVDAAVTASDTLSGTPGLSLSDRTKQLLDAYNALTASAAKGPVSTALTNLSTFMINIIKAIRTRYSAAPTVTPTVRFKLQADIGKYIDSSGMTDATEVLAYHHKYLSNLAVANRFDILATGADLDDVAAFLGFTNGTILLTPPVPAEVTAEYAATTTAKERGDVALLVVQNAVKEAIAFFNFLDSTQDNYEKILNEALLSSFGTYKELVGKAGDALNLMPPSGAVAGVYAATDRDRGVWKAPANVSLNAVVGPATKINHDQQMEYNVDVNAGKSINIIRPFLGKGTLIWGARTLAGNDNEWRYVNVRRFFNFVEESCKKATEQFVFEPNDANTWVRLQAMIENFLTVLWRQGALQGIKPEHAFYVAVGLGKTMTALDILEGRLIVEIGMAAVRPAEFIILRFSHKMAES